MKLTIAIEKSLITMRSPISGVEMNLKHLDGMRQSTI